MTRLELRQQAISAKQSAITNTQMLRAKLLLAGLKYWAGTESNATGIIKATDDMLASANLTSQDILNAAYMLPADALIYIRRIVYPYTEGSHYTICGR